MGYVYRRSERHKLYNHWKAELQTMWLTDLKQAMSEYESVREEQRRVQADVDLNVLKQARLVGMTTAGVASKQDLVAAMAPKVCACVRVHVHDSRCQEYATHS